MYVYIPRTRTTQYLLLSPRLTSKPHRFLCLSLSFLSFVLGFDLKYWPWPGENTTMSSSCRHCISLFSFFAEWRCFQCESTVAIETPLTYCSRFLCSFTRRTSIIWTMPQWGGGGDKCPRCQKTVYPAEKIAACSSSWHKACFKCKTCTLF